jgi:hypothetical protein
MPTPGDDGPSVFSKYIGGPDKEQPSPLERMIRQSRRGADIKTFLLDVLMNGPVPATLVEERGAAHGFTKIQIRYARRQMNIISFKGPGKGGCWFWVLPHDNRGVPARQATPSTPFPLNQ